MSNWSAWKFTTAGKAIQTKVEAGKTLTFTKFVFGDGIATSIDDYTDRTELIEPKITCDVADVTVDENNFAKVSCVITNKDLTEKTYIREVGLYAKEPDTGVETLFLVSIDDAADCIPAKGTAAVVTTTFNVCIMVSENENVTAVINPDGIVTQAAMKTETAKVEKSVTESVTASATTLIGTYADSIFRQPSTAYSVGDVVYVKGAGAKYRLSCVTAGTTSADELSAASITGGQS